MIDCIQCNLLHHAQLYTSAVELHVAVCDNSANSAAPNKHVYGCCGLNSGTPAGLGTISTKPPPGSSSSSQQPAAHSTPRSQECSTTWVQRLANGECPSRDSNSSGVSNNSQGSGASSFSSTRSHTSKQSIGGGSGIGTGSTVCGTRTYTSCRNRSTAGSFAKDKPGRSSAGGTGGKCSRNIYIVLPLLLLVAALGVGAWGWAYVITTADTGRTVGAVPAATGASVLLFRVTVAVPSMAANQGCGRWFDGVQVGTQLDVPPTVLIVQTCEA